jgi:hypothetical protein
MGGFDEISQAFADGCRQGAAVLRSCLEWDLDEESPPMEKAEDEAIRAYLAVADGKLLCALSHARRACGFEQQEFQDCPTWRPLCTAIEAALRRESTFAARELRKEPMPCVALS